MRARYGVFVVNTNSNLCSASVTRVLYAILCCIGPCYNGTRLYVVIPSCIDVVLTLLNNSGSVAQWFYIDLFIRIINNTQVQIINSWALPLLFLNNFLIDSFTEYIWYGFHFTKYICAHNWNLRKIHLILMIQSMSSHNFAHVMTAELSWHVQNCGLNWWLFWMQEQHIILQDLDYELMKSFYEMGPLSHHHLPHLSPRNRS